MPSLSCAEQLIIEGDLDAGQALLLEFEQLGASSEVLIFLLENENDPTLKKREAKILRLQAEQFKIVGDILEAEGASGDMLTGIRFIERTKRAAGEPIASPPVLVRRYFWIGALVPYLQTVLGQPRWKWFDQWIGWLEHPPKDNEPITPVNIRSLLVKPTPFLRKIVRMKAGWGYIPKLSVHQQQTMEALELGVRYCMLGLRGVSNLDDEGLDEQAMVKDWGRDNFERAYYKRVISLWPRIGQEIGQWLNPSYENRRA